MKLLISSFRLTSCFAVFHPLTLPGSDLMIVLVMFGWNHLFWLLPVLYTRNLRYVTNILSKCGEEFHFQIFACVTVRALLNTLCIAIPLYSFYFTDTRRMAEAVNAVSEDAQGPGLSDTIRHSSQPFTGEGNRPLKLKATGLHSQSEIAWCKLKLLTEHLSSDNEEQGGSKRPKLEPQQGFLSQSSRNVAVVCRSTSISSNFDSKIFQLLPMI